MSRIDFKRSDKVSRIDFTKSKVSRIDFTRSREKVSRESIKMVEERDGNLNRNRSGSRLKVESKRMAGLRRNAESNLMIDAGLTLTVGSRRKVESRQTIESRLKVDHNPQKDETPKMCAK